MRDYTYRFTASIAGLLLLVVALLSNTREVRKERPAATEKQRIQTDD